MYVDAIHDRYKDKILVAERIDGERIENILDAEYVYYYEHPAGQFRTIYDEPCKKIVTHSNKDFRLKMDVTAGKRNAFGKTKPDKPRRIFESDINPVFRALEANYKNAPTPTLHVAFFDIEADWDEKRGYAPTDDPFNKVTAISVWCKWLDDMYTLVLCPPSLGSSEAVAIGNKFENTVVFDNEADLLASFLEVIYDADVLSGWNSEGYDIPYLVNRIKRVLGDDYAKKFCLWNQSPREREYEKFGKTFKSYDLVGRVHLDYLLLYQKHNPQQLHSYRLDYVGEIEVGENKVPYEGTLDDLYKKDFEKFIAYNRQDTALLNKIDDKKKFIELANQVAHGNCVLLKTTMGSVALVEQAIINDMHEMGFIVHDRKRTLDERLGLKALDDDDDDVVDDGRTPVVGAYVANPKIGEHEHVGCCDINSLYPSAIRALNMSPETVVGQFRPDETIAYIAQKVLELGPQKRAEAWDGIFYCHEYGHIMAEDDTLLTLDYDDGRSVTKTGAEWYAHIFDPANHLCITANGTVFSTEKDGMIPMLLAKWYAERKEMQGKAKSFKKKADAETDPELKKDYSFQAGFWDQRQQARKILLNSLYGALLNEGLRFYDERLGQSVTLTGRSIVRHMNAKMNEVVTGKYDYKGDAIVYADTDSCYFSAYEVLKNDPAFADYEWSRDNIVALYDDMADIVNKSFPEFMQRTFNTTLERGGIIMAGRELVASKAHFIKKKKYACLIYDLEGTRLDVNGKPGKLKAMGLDLKRADTPKFMQVFLEKLLMDFLTNVPKADLFSQIRQFRHDFKARPGWEKGTPKKVNGISEYAKQQEKAASKRVDQGAFTKKGKMKASGNVLMPGHVRASINWNSMCEEMQDRHVIRVSDGAKVIVCKLRPNIMKMDSIAYPIDEPHIPRWFKDLMFDHAAMEDTIIDNKLENLFGVLNWDLSVTKELPADDVFVFPG